MFRYLVGAATAVAFAAGIATPAASQSFRCDGGEIVIGMAKAQTGGFAFFDNVGGQGAIIAIDQINDGGGIHGCKIRLIRGDTQSDPAKAGQVAEELIGQGAEILIVPSDFDIGVGASQAAQAAGVFSISPEASSTAWTQAIGPNHFTAAITVRDLGKAQGAYANGQGFKRGYLVTNTAFNFFTAMEDVFKESFNGEVVARDVVADDASDYSAVVSKIRGQRDADFIYLNDYFPHVGTFIKQLRAAGVDLPIVGNSTFSSLALPEVVGAEGLENVAYIGQSFYEGPGAAPEVLDLAKRYQDKFGNFPENANALAGFEGMLMLAAALEKAGSTDAAAITAAMSAQRNFQLPGSTVYQWTDRYPVRSATVIGFRNGEFVEIERVDPR